MNKCPYCNSENLEFNKEKTTAYCQSCESFIDVEKNNAFYSEARELLRKRKENKK